MSAIHLHSGAIPLPCEGGMKKTSIKAMEGEGLITSLVLDKVAC